MHLARRVVRTAVFLVGALLMVAIGGEILMWPGKRRLPRYRKTAVGGIQTIDDAVALCRQSGLHGWDLVFLAQQLTTRKFSTYSTLNAWDSPSRAFEFGTGYCSQYNLALERILQRLGFAVQTVYATRVRVLHDRRWTMGHTWLRVTIDSRTLDVCAGYPQNRPGHVDFQPLTPVRRAGEARFFLLQLGMILFVGFLEWRSLITGADPPWWSYVPRDQLAQTRT